MARPVVSSRGGAREETACAGGEARPGWVPGWVRQWGLGKQPVVERERRAGEGRKEGRKEGPSSDWSESA